MTTNKNNLLLTYYGDDFTGSTDVLEALTLGGVRTALFFAPPTREQLSGRFADLQAVGVAGVSRSMTTEQIDSELRPAFQKLKGLNAPLCHYKVCSTFDSSPHVGSIGRAIDIGWEIFNPSFVPLMVGAPALKRYVAFANLFATVGGETYRIDRHPTMSRHPITPMNEGDLRLHLAQQTEKTIALLDLLHLTGSSDEIDRRFQSLLDDNPNIILFDTIGEEHLSSIGRLIWQQTGHKPVFVAGSSGVEYALTTYWQEIKLVAKGETLSAPGAVKQLIVMAGSASPTTASQIQWAIDHGFAPFRLNTLRLIDPATADAERKDTIREALAILETGQSLVIYSALGPEDASIEATSHHMENLGLNPNHIGQRLGQQQGQILSDLLDKSGIRRVCVAGGDTSGHTALQLGIYALEMAASIAPGAPLCRASSHQAKFDGLEIALKGGQNGGTHYFGQIKQGASQISIGEI